MDFDQTTGMYHALSIEVRPSGRIKIKRTVSSRIPRKARPRIKPHTNTCPYMNNSTKSVSSPSKFSRRANEQIYEACVALESYDKENVYLMTFTLPGSATAAIDMLEEEKNLAKVVRDLSRYIRENAPSVPYVRVWERQSNGALHLHYAIHLPAEHRQRFSEARLKKVWSRILNCIGKKNGGNMFETMEGASWEKSPSLWRVEVERCRTSLAGYLAKSETKVSRERSDGRIVGPKRWYQISAPLHSLIKNIGMRRVFLCQSAIEQQDLERKLIESIKSTKPSKLILNDFTGEVIGVSLWTNSLKDVQQTIEKVTDGLTNIVLRC